MLGKSLSLLSLSFLIFSSSLCVHFRTDPFTSVPNFFRSAGSSVRSNHYPRMLYSPWAAGESSISGKTALIIGVSALATGFMAYKLYKYFNTDSAKDIFTYCQLGDAKKIAALLEKDPYLVETIDEDGNIPLITACWFGHLDVVKLLVAKGANINAYGSHWTTPLKAAIRGGHLAIVTYLLDQGVPLEAQQENEYSPLMVAAWHGKTAIVKELLARGAKKNAITSLTACDVVFRLLDNETNLPQKAKENYHAIAELLI